MLTPDFLPIAVPHHRNPSLHRLHNPLKANPLLLLLPPLPRNLVPLLRLLHRFHLHRKPLRHLVGGPVYVRSHRRVLGPARCRRRVYLLEPPAALHHAGCVWVCDGFHAADLADSDVGRVADEYEEEAGSDWIVLCGQCDVDYVDY